ncbi:MAG: Crp/Fnr family transcriptional regulator [Bacteroidota bacterium]
MANNQSFWYLENIDVTNIFCPNKLEDALKSHAHKKYKKGQYIYLPDEDADKIYFIAEGSVKVGHYGEGNKEITKAILEKGEVFGELSLVGQSTRRDFVMAMENTIVCILSKEEMNALMKDHSGFSIFMMKLMGSRMLEMEKRLESLVFKDSRTRVIEFLKNLADKKGQRVGYETLVRGFMTHQEIANLTATSRQTVTTVLNELRTKNVLTFNRRRLLIRDLDLLAKEGNL